MPATPTDGRGRLASAAEPTATGERIDVLHAGAGATIEHIVSAAGVRSEVYDQDHDEWVLLLEGAATLDVEGDPVALEPGDWLLLPAHRRHQVTSTATGTRWLAVHLPP